MNIRYRNVYGHQNILQTSVRKGVFTFESARKAARMGASLETVMNLERRTWIGVEMIAVSKKGITVVMFYPNKEKS